MAQLLRVFRRAAADERGVGLPTAMFTALTVFALGAVWSQVGVHSVERSVYDRSREQSVDAAEAGVNMAMSQLTLDPDYSGGSGTLNDSTGEYEVTVEPVDPSNPDDMRRRIVSTGYAPDRADHHRIAERRLEAQVDLEKATGFEYALFAGGGTVGGANHMTVSGDVYGQTGVHLTNNADVNGSIVSPGDVTTANNSLIAGDIRSDGNVTLENPATTVQGSVYAGGSISVNAQVRGDAQAGSTITVTNTGNVQGDVAPDSPPPPVVQEQLPTFTWDPANYDPAPTTWSSASDWQADFHAKAIAGTPYSGHHKINSTGAIALDKRWKIGDDTTIVTDGSVTLSRDVTNTAGATVDLVIVSFSTSGITFENNVTFPSNVRVLLFAPNGPVTFKNLKHFTGTVYSQSIQLDQNFTLTHSKLEPPGFSFDTATAVQYQVILRVLREVSVN